MRPWLRFDIRQAGRPIALILGLVAALNLGFFLLYVQPAVGHYRELKASAAGQDRLEERQTEVEQREAFLVRLQQAEEGLRHLRSEVLSTREARMVVVQLELAELAKQFHINLEQVNYGGELLLDEELDRFVIDVPLEGGYAALRRFLQALEQSNKFLIVERVALGKGKEGGVTLQLNITLATYFNAPEDLVQRKREMERRGRRGGQRG